jgi:hypothetical protein
LASQGTLLTTNEILRRYAPQNDTKWRQYLRNVTLSNYSATVIPSDRKERSD